jgi:acetyl esterase/lipase
MPGIMMRSMIAAGLIFAAAAGSDARDVPGSVSVRLWPDGAPGSEKRHGEAEIAGDGYPHNIHDPSLTIFQPDPRHANGAAVVVVPGGGHRMLVFTNEGVMPARLLNRNGIAAFVLKYRLARDEGSTYTIEGDATADARRAVRWVRAHAADYGVDPHRIGIMGFSAGGELVTQVADTHEPARAAKSDAIDRLSARPDFQILVYPGPLGIPAKAVEGAPPAFLAAGTLDQCCALPALTLYQQLRTAKVSAELHLLADTDHGFNVAMHSERLSVQRWPDMLMAWLSDGGWLRPTDPKAAGAKPFE